MCYGSCKFTATMEAVQGEPGQGSIFHSSSWFSNSALSVCGFQAHRPFFRPKSEANFKLTAGLGATALSVI